MYVASFKYKFEIANSVIRQKTHTRNKMYRFIFFCTMSIRKNLHFRKIEQSCHFYTLVTAIKFYNTKTTKICSTIRCKTHGELRQKTI